MNIAQRPALEGAGLEQACRWRIILLLNHFSPELPHARRERRARRSGRCLNIMDPTISVCFVCLGNICRSPTAEGVFLELVRRAGLLDRVVVESAGTAAYHVGELPDSRSREHAARRGLQLISRARQFQSVDFERFDYVLAMDQQNHRDLVALRSMARNAKVHLGLFRDFDTTAPRGSSVPDPYYGGADGFEEVLDQCERAAAGLLETIRTRLGQS